MACCFAEKILECLDSVHALSVLMEGITVVHVTVLVLADTDPSV